MFYTFGTNPLFCAIFVRVFTMYNFTSVGIHKANSNLPPTWLRSPWHASAQPIFAGSGQNFSGQHPIQLPRIRGKRFRYADILLYKRLLDVESKLYWAMFILGLTSNSQLLQVIIY